ncbi:MAG: hypothetical protein PHQ22_10820 [Sulfuricurvum sp.]|nr:hypothetical protein [Sulfuricurvum sp.]
MTTYTLDALKSLVNNGNEASFIALERTMTDASYPIESFTVSNGLVTIVYGTGKGESASNGETRTCNAEMFIIAVLGQMSISPATIFHTFHAGRPKLKGMGDKGYYFACFNRLVTSANSMGETIPKHVATALDSTEQLLLDITASFNARIVGIKDTLASVKGNASLQSDYLNIVSTARPLAIDGIDVDTSATSALLQVEKFASVLETFANCFANAKTSDEENASGNSKGFNIELTSVPTVRADNTISVLAETGDAHKTVLERIKTTLPNYKCNAKDLEEGYYRYTLTLKVN